MKKETGASIFIILAGFLWGIVGLFVRQMSACGFDTYQIVFTRQGISALVFGLFLLLADKSKLKIALKDSWMFFATGFICIFFHNITFFYASIHSEYSVASVLVNTSPIYIMLASALLFNEKITKRKVFALCLTVCGCVFVSGVLGGHFTVKLSMVFLSLLSGFLYGMYTIFSRFALKKYSNETVSFYTYTFAFLGSLFFVNIPQSLEIVFSSSGALFTCVSNGIVTCLLPFFFYTAGLKYVENTKAAILVSVDPIVATVSGILVLKESSSPVKLIGCALIILSIVVLNTKSQESSPESSLSCNG